MDEFNLETTAGFSEIAAIFKEETRLICVGRGSS